MTAGAERKPVAVVVPTRDAAATLARCLAPLVAAACDPHILVVDSDSRDATREIAHDFGARVIPVQPGDFNHGLTREHARHETGAEIVVMLTQDVAPGDGALDRLIAPIQLGQAEATYGRQVARPGAGVVESFDRAFNYPASGHVRSQADVASMGVMAFFLSNAFAAYSSRALDAVGGFPRTLSNEDAIIAARLLHAGYRIAYAADAVAAHSHPPAIGATFRRYFDAGYARAEFADDFSAAGGHGGAGRSYVRSLLLAALRRHPQALPCAIGQIGAKALGYGLGSQAHRLPPAVSRRASAQPAYWNDPV